MKSNIDDLCDAFIAAITDEGYAPKSIENYKQVSNRFKKFCTENDYDTYTANIGQMFADNVFNEKTGELVRYRYVMYGRFVRLINSFCLQGAFDFSMVKKEKSLPTSTQLIELYQNYTNDCRKIISAKQTISCNSYCCCFAIARYICQIRQGFGQVCYTPNSNCH